MEELPICHQFLTNPKYISAKMKKHVYIMFIGLFFIGCSPRLGTFVAQAPKALLGSGLQLNEDSSFVYQTWQEWYETNSFGKWCPLHGKANAICLTSSISDFSHIPIAVTEKKNDNNDVIVILKQGVRFYDCEYNELIVNGEPIVIDRDTIILSYGQIDSLAVRLGFSEQMRLRMAPTPQYSEVCTEVYYSQTPMSNQFEISLPSYPHYRDSAPRALALFLYFPMNTEAIYKGGKWHIMTKDGKAVVYKRIKN